MSTFVNFLKQNATLIALVLLALIMGFADDAFFTPRNLTNLSRQVVIIGVIAVGMTMVILIAGIDLSVGSLVGLSAILVTLLMQKGINVWVAIGLTVMLSGIIIGLWNGFWIAYYKIPPFIITLGMMTIARGLALTLSKGSSIPVTDPTFPRIGGDYISIQLSIAILVIGAVLYALATVRSVRQRQKYGIEIGKVELVTNAIIGVLGLTLAFYIFGSYRGIPVPVAIFVAIALGGAFVLNNTRFGRQLYAVGGNEEAARLSGINVFRSKMIVYISVAVLSSISGILLASRLNGASPNLGNMFELDAIAAVVIGGTSLAGGVGTIGGTIIGAFIIGVLNNGMSLLGVETFYQLMIKGFIIILAVWFDVLNKNK